jgi:cell division protein ZapE
VAVCRNFSNQFIRRGAVAHLHRIYFRLLISKRTHIIGASELHQLASRSVDVSHIPLEPPKHFANALLQNYYPAPAEDSETAFASQRDAVTAIQAFVKRIEKQTKRRTWHTILLRSKARGAGLYLDGGFGVGKTHLLAGAYHAFRGNKAYLSFQELMFLVGLQTLARTAQSFSKYELLAIDELELDDPANTRITTNLLGQLFDVGVNIITTSNTPPGALGEGKFSVADFKRELGELTRQFKIIRIEGEDYRVAHHQFESDPSFAKNLNPFELATLMESTLVEGAVLKISFSELLVALGSAHPIRIREAVSGISAVIVDQVAQIANPHQALLFVYLIDKLYDNNSVLFFHSEIALDALFNTSYITGGDTKKYHRTLSRLKEMTAISQNLYYQLIKAKTH